MALPSNLAESSVGCQKSASVSCNSSLLPHQVYRRVLRQCVASICHSVGFHSAQNSSLDALTVLLHQFFSKTCQSSRSLCEHTGRSLVNAGDIFMALVDEGRPGLADFDKFLYRVRHSKHHTFSLIPQTPTKTPPVLRIADPRPHPSHFPNFLPPFPDPHTYIRSEIRDDTDTNYERVRRLDAQNKRDWEKSLVRYAITQFPTVSVFRELDARLVFEAKDALEKQREENRLRRRQSKKQQRGGPAPTGAVENGVEEAQKKPTDAPLAVDLGTAPGGEVPPTEGAEGASAEEILLPPTENEEEVVLPDTEKVGTDVAENNETMDGISTTTKSVELQKQNNANGIAVDSPSKNEPTVEELLAEELSHPLDTERAIVLKHIPHFCYILLPFDEPRPYLSALLTDDADQTVDDEQHNDYFARILSKEMDEDMESGGMEGEEGGAGGRSSTTAMELGGANE